jgi:hypothetical protein
MTTISITLKMRLLTQHSNAKNKKSVLILGVVYDRWRGASVICTYNINENGIYIYIYIFTMAFTIYVYTHEYVSVCVCV